MAKRRNGRPRICLASPLINPAHLAEECGGSVADGGLVWGIVYHGIELGCDPTPPPERV